MRKLKKRWSFVLSVVILCSLLGQCASPLSVAAKEDTQVIDTDPVIWNGGDLPDTDELFAGYVTQEMYAGTKKEIAPFANFGEQRLTGINKTLYQKLKASFEKVANGEESSTIFEIPVSDLEIQTTWTAEELGITIQSANEEIWSAIKSKLSEQGYDYNVLLDCLLADCPYDLYWYDKTEGTSISSGSFSRSTSGGKVTNVSLTGFFRFSMTVVQEYRSSEYETDTAKTAAATTAVNNAKEIVNQYTSQSDYDKLTAYKDTICNLVSYNDEAAYDPSTPYGDPWQLIWVFDENPTTNVVCEGYSKAFQYLCDLTEFSSDAITCYTVTGYLSGGGHMWNIVTMNDNNNYLVDVTNCDTGTVGAPDKLFLAGLSGSLDSYYSFSSVTYSYDTDTKALFGENILTLASSNYQNGTSPNVTVSISGNTTMTYGDNNTLTAKISGTDEECECTYQWYVNGQPVDGATEKTYNLSTLGAGEHSVRAQVKVDEDSFTSSSYSISVKKYTPAIIFNESSLNYYYTGKPVSAPETTVTLVNNETYQGEISYSYRKGEDTEWSSGLPTEVGTYSIKAQTEEQDNYSKAKTETDCQITIAYVPFTSAILYDNTEKNTWYNQSVSISANNYQVSDSLTGSFSDTYRIEAPKTDGTLQKTLYFKNQNGEISDGQTVTLSFDVSAPTGSIQLGTKTWQDFSAGNTFEKYIVGENNTVTITAQDHTSGMENDGIQYYIYKGNTPYTDVDSLEKASISWTTYAENQKLILPENQNCVLYVKLTDQLGNTSYLCSGGIYIQKEEDEITPPQISNVTAEDSAVETTGATITVGMTTACTFYYVVLPAGANVPTAADIIATVNAIDAGASGGTAITGTVTSGSGVVSDGMIANNENGQITLTGLQANTNYVIYFVSVIYVTDISSGDNSIASYVGDMSAQSIKTKQQASVTQKPEESVSETPASGSATGDRPSVSSAASLSNGAVFSAGVLRYRVTDAAKKQVEVIGLGKNARKVTIPATVCASSTGEQFRVVSIGNKAFKNNKKMKKVVIGSSVKRIGKQAFANCKKLKSMTIQTKSLKMNTVGNKAFRGISAKAVIKTPKKKLQLYQKILRKKGAGTGVTIR